MPSDKTNDRLAVAEESFRAQILAQYDLEADFVSVVCGFFRTSAEPLLEGGVAPKRTRAGADASVVAKPKKSRKKSAYNVFVREMMKSADVQKLDHKEKMGAIAALWKGLGEDSKVQYTDLAKTENDTSTEDSA
jgi:hypothetical protein